MSDELTVVASEPHIQHCSSVWQHVFFLGASPLGMVFMIVITQTGTVWYLNGTPLVPFSAHVSVLVQFGQYKIRGFACGLH